MKAEPTQQQELNFRFATIEDVPSLLILVESAYRGDVSRKGWTTEADLLDGQRTDVEELTRLVSNPKQGEVLLALREQIIVACANLEKRDGFVYFGMFSVSPSEQGSGIGKYLLQEAERIVRQEWQISKIKMTVIVQRVELIAWYERRGYSKTGEHRPWPYGDLRFGIPKRDDLAFLVLEKNLQ